jgi:hypothetical protein
LFDERAANLIERFASELEQISNELDDEELDPTTAEEFSGYSTDHLRRLEIAGVC